MLTGSLLRLPAIKVMNMEQSRCNADAKHIRHFLDICDGNWHSCIYVRCVSCKTPGYCNGPHFLYHPDENGSPCVLPMADARMLFSRIPEPTECLSAITLEQFQSLYGLYFAKEALTDKPCPCFCFTAAPGSISLSLVKGCTFGTFCVQDKKGGDFYV